MIELPRGTDLLQDIKRTFGPAAVQSFHTVFDVGANTGQSAHQFVAEFPHATIYCFEPVQESFDALVRNTKQHPNVKPFRFALDAEEGETPIYIGKESTLASVVFKDEQCRMELVHTTTIDTFCSEHKIAAIDLLKIDAEGAELLVLGGARRMMENKKVAFVQAEACLENKEGRFVPAHGIIKLLAPYGFEVFGIYDQMPHLLDDSPMLSYFNLVLMNRHMIRKA